MRFGIRDLLFATTIVSVYAAVVGVVLSHGGFRSRLSDWGVIPIMLISIVWSIIARARERLAAGRLRLTVRTRSRLRWDFLIAFLAIGLTLLILADGTSQPTSLFLLCGILFHVLNVGSTHLTFTNRGILSGKLRRWEDWEFQVRERPARLLGQPSLNPHRVAPIAFKIPPTSVEEVRAILAEKQPTTDDTAST